VGSIHSTLLSGKPKATPSAGGQEIEV